MTEEILSSASITGNLGTAFVGQRVIHYPSLTSTMDAARLEAQQGAAEGTVIITDEQTAGKGRIKRVWLTPRGNIALSVILYPSAIHLPSLIMLSSLAVAYSIEAVTGLRAALKWPNDVLVNGKKVGGILIESDVRAGVVRYAIIGIGINVSLRPTDFPEIAATATSLSTELGKDVSRLALVRRLLAEVERLYLGLSRGDSVYQEWRARLVTLGRGVRVKSGESVLEGVAESVDSEGGLWLRHSSGSSTRIVAGDVTVRDSELSR